VEETDIGSNKSDAPSVKLENRVKKDRHYEGSAIVSILIPILISTDDIEVARPTYSQ
jgi:hypothetical protein